MLDVYYKQKLDLPPLRMPDSIVAKSMPFLLLMKVMMLTWTKNTSGHCELCVCNCKWELCEEPTKGSKGRNSQFKWTGGSKTLLWKRTFSTLLNSLCANNVQSLLIGVFVLCQFYHAVFFLIIKINILPNPKDTLLLKALSVMSALPIYGQWSSLMIMFPSIPFWQIHWLHLPISLLPPVCSNQSLLLDHNIPAASWRQCWRWGTTRWAGAVSLIFLLIISISTFRFQYKCHWYHHKIYFNWKWMNVFQINSD